MNKLMNKLIYDDKCPVCSSITAGLRFFPLNDDLTFVPASTFWPAAAKYNIKKEELLGTLFYISKYGMIKKDAEACVYVLSNIKHLGIIKNLYFRPISYLFDLAYYILKQFRVFVYKLNKKYPHLFN